MNNGSVREAVILAAGNGVRLAKASSLPKPLVTIAGRSLLDRILGRLTEAGFERVCVVTGYRGNELQQSSFPSADSVQLDWVHNPDFHLPNGVSLLAVEGRVRSPFLLLMSDHLFEKATLERFLNSPVPACGGVLATDAKIDTVFDLGDATKVDCEGQRIRSLGKDLTEFNAVDTGMFLLNESVFPAMKQSLFRGDGSLSGGISMLAGSEGVCTHDIGNRRWIDIDTPQALEEAERMVRMDILS